MTASGAGRLRVAVASDQSLVVEAVRAALSARKLNVTTLGWSTDRTPMPRRVGATRSFDVGLIISDLDKWSRLRGVASVMGTVRVPWVVLTGACRGPLWGAALEFGARAVISSDTSLRGVHATLRGVIRGEMVPPPAESVLLRAEWQALREQREGLQARVGTLTPREREVLRLLYAGDSVARIAAIFDVSPTTVRSQVKAVLRKLDVNSQLAAVAAFDQLLELDDPVRLDYSLAGG